MNREPPSGAQASRLVRSLGGRFSLELGIDPDQGEEEVERWMLCACLYGARISSQLALRACRSLARGGVRTLADAGRRTWDDLVRLLDEGGYARYDFSTATKLQRLSLHLAGCYPSGISALGDRGLPALEAALDALPGWGEVTVHLFLRELRGTWRAVEEMEVDPKALVAARHLGWPIPGQARVAWLREAARAGGVDIRDLEAALIRLTLAHGRAMARCPGGPSCPWLEEREGMG